MILCCLSCLGECTYVILGGMISVQLCLLLTIHTMAHMGPTAVLSFHRAETMAMNFLELALFFPEVFH